MHRQILRSEFLRLGAAGAVGTLLGGAGAAIAQTPTPAPTPAPKGDDISYVQWGAIAEMLSVAFWQRALDDGDFSRRVERRIRTVRDVDKDHLARLNAVLGEDAPDPNDFIISLPDSAFRTRARILAFGQEIEHRIVGVYLDGVARTTDQETRLLLGRLLVADGQHLSVLRGLAGEPLADTGLPGPQRVAPAGEWIDRFLQSRSFPTES